MPTHKIRMPSFEVMNFEVEIRICVIIGISTLKSLKMSMNFGTIKVTSRSR
jgi:hypothetical protein